MQRRPVPAINFLFGVVILSNHPLGVTSATHPKIHRPITPFLLPRMLYPIPNEESINRKHDPDEKAPPNSPVFETAILFAIFWRQ